MTPATPAIVLTAFAGGLLLGCLWSPRCPRPRRPRELVSAPAQRLTLIEGRTQRGNGHSGPTTFKKEILSRGSNYPLPDSKASAIKPQPSGGRLYVGKYYRMKNNDIWFPVGTEPDWARLAQEQAQRRLHDDLCGPQLPAQVVICATEEDAIEYGDQFIKPELSQQHETGSQPVGGCQGVGNEPQLPRLPIQPKGWRQ